MYYVQLSRIHLYFKFLFSIILWESILKLLLKFDSFNLQGLNGITHASKASKTNFKFQWTAPDTTVGGTVTFL